MLGDTPYDAEAASKVHVRAIGVLCGGFSEQGLRRAGGKEVYAGPATLLAKFDQSHRHVQSAVPGFVAGPASGRS